MSVGQVKAIRSPVTTSHGYSQKPTTIAKALFAISSLALMFTSTQSKLRACNPIGDPSECALDSYCDSYWKFWAPVTVPQGMSPVNVLRALQLVKDFPSIDPLAHSPNQSALVEEAWKATGLGKEKTHYGDRYVDYVEKTPIRTDFTCFPLLDARGYEKVHGAGTAQRAVDLYYQNVKEKLDDGDKTLKYIHTWTPPYTLEHCLSYSRVPSFIQTLINVQKIKHYTIVLAPVSKQTTKYTTAAQTLFGKYAAGYLLNDKTSFEHITVVQFDCDTLDSAVQVWLEFREKMHAISFKPFVPTFTGVVFTEGTGAENGTMWVDLSVKRGKNNSPIMQVHKPAVKVLRKHRITPLNGVDTENESSYRPHLTLARTKGSEKIMMWSKSLFENTDLFTLEFGGSDAGFQYVYTFDSYRT